MQVFHLQSMEFVSLNCLNGMRNAFDHLYCVAFRLLDAQWLVKRASYMEFNVSFWRVQYIDRSLFVLRQWHSYLWFCCTRRS